MNVLLIGSGGREHALAWKIAQSPLLDRLYIAPGNPGTAACGINVAIPVNNFPAIAQLIRNENIQLVIVGPEDPLVNGFHDFIREQDDLGWVGVIGPDSEGAKLEGSKDYAKQFMVGNGIPTAKYHTVSVQTTAGMQNRAGVGEPSVETHHDASLQIASAIIHDMKPPYVLKADGLAAGKGVVILDDPDEAIRELDAMFSGKFGSAGKKVVIEEYLRGIELSVFILTDGDSYVLLPEAKDYKRIGEGDTGLNTGGMGAVSPVPFADREFMEKVRIRIIEPTLKGLRARPGAYPYKGFIFFGLMNVSGDPYVIEYNVRMGDPESEAVIPRIDSDLLDLMISVKSGRLKDREIRISDAAATTVMLVSEGYPGAYEKGRAISGVGDFSQGVVFHSGTAIRDGELITAGGRVLALTSMHPDWKTALDQSYGMASGISFEGMYFRRDIGFDL